MKILHQCGHNTKWDIDSIGLYGAGSGLILSPLHMKKEKVINLSSDIKSMSLFDPQFYIPGSQKENLLSYDFFPGNIATDEDSSFDTSNFYPKAYKAAKECLAFQVENNFSAIIIPTRYYPEMLSDFIQRQKDFTVDPFINALKEFSVANSYRKYLSLSLKAPMVEDKGFCKKILDWVTSYREIDGVYIMIDFDDNLKQVNEYSKLKGYTDFIKILQNAELKVICGYANTEGLVLSLLSPEFITVGAYENTRMFSVAKFLNEASGFGPAPRFYMPNLLNWVRFETLVDIKNRTPDLWERIYTPTVFSEVYFQGNEKPHFTKSGIYHHHFELIHKQYKYLGELEQKKRADLLLTWVHTATDLYEEISKANILLYDDNCSGSHLPAWEKIIKSYVT